MVRRYVEQDNEDCQPLRIYGTPRVIINNSKDWQLLFNADSQLIRAVRVLKIAGEYDKATLDHIRLAAYLYIANTGNTSRAESCIFNFYKITGQWTETKILSLSATELPNGYWYADIPSSSISDIDLDGSSSVMVEVFLKRLKDTYRDRVYLNAIGIFGNAVMLRNDVDFLDISKVDE